MLELHQDGVAEAEADEVYRLVRASMRSLKMPHGALLLRLAALLIPTVIVSAWLWSQVKPGPAGTDSYWGEVLLAMGVALLTGLTMALAAALGSGVPRSWKVGLVAVAGDALALVVPSKIVNAQGLGVTLTEWGIILAACVTLWVLTRTPRPRYLLSFEADGSFRWTREPDIRTPWTRLLDRHSPHYDPGTDYYWLTYLRRR
jgi:hypothetical protein